MREQVLLGIVTTLAIIVGYWRGSEYIKIRNQVLEAEAELKTILEKLQRPIPTPYRAFHEERDSAPPFSKILERSMERHKSQSTGSSVVNKAATQYCVGNTQPFAFVPPAACIGSTPIVIAYFGSGNPPTDYVTEDNKGLNAIVMFKAPDGAYTNIPTDINLLPSLEWIVCRQTLLGTIPSGLYQSTSLIHIYLPFNKLGGTISTEIGLMTQLTNLELFVNSFSGTLPTQMGRLSQLFHLNLESNSFSGTIPTQFGNMQSLIDIDLNLNPDIIGPFPTELTRLMNLKRIEMSNTHISGTLPTEIGYLSQLTTLKLSQTWLNGTIPEEINTLPLVSLDLSSNGFTGTISPNLQNFNASVMWISLSNNLLSGTIPSQLGLLTLLTSLLLANNSFTGTVPTELEQLTALASLDITTNKLSGSLPFLPGVTVSCLNSGLTDEECIPKAKFLKTKTSNIVFGFVGGVGAVLVATLTFVLKHHSHPAVAASGAGFSVLLLIGLFAVNMSIIPLGFSMRDVPTTHRVESCQALIHLLTYGIIVVLSCVSARIFPLAHSLFLKKENIRDKLPPGTLSLVVGVSVLLSLPMTVVMSVSVHAPRSSFSCAIAYGQAPLIALLVYISCHAFFALVLCVKIRQADARYGESKSLARATLNLLCFGTALIVLALKTPEATSRFLSISLCILLCVLTFVCLYFGYKLYLIVKNPTMQYSSSSNNAAGNSGSTPFKFVTFAASSASNPPKSEAKTEAQSGASWAGND